MKRESEIGNTTKVSIINEDLPAKEEYIKSSSGSEKEGGKIEDSSGPSKERINISEKAEKIEKILDGIEERLGDLEIDGSEVLKNYQMMNKEKAEKVAGEDGAEKFIESLIKNDPDGVRTVAIEKGFSPAQMAVLVACFLFLMLGKVPNESINVEANTTDIESPQEIEKNDVDRFIDKLKIAKVDQGQEFLDIKIPAKPKGCENQNWKIYFYEHGAVIGEKEIGNEIEYTSFGKGSDQKADKAELVIMENDEIVREVNIDIAK